MLFGTVAPLASLLDGDYYEWTETETENEDAPDEDGKIGSEQSKEKELLAACWPFEYISPADELVKTKVVFMTNIQWGPSCYLQLPELPPEQTA